FCLLPSIDSQSHPELLTRFRPDEVIAMDFEHQGLYTDNNTIKNACQIGGLETLVLRECREVTDESIAYIDKLPNFKAIDVAISGVTLDGLLKLHRLRELQRIGAKGYDAHRLLSALKGSQALTSLNLRFSDLSDDDMNLLAGLTKLRHLNISGNKFTDKGFEKLSQLHQLNSLYAEGNRVSGAAAFAALSKLPLKQLHITTTGWSSAALAKLKKALPNCQMNVDTINEPNFAHPDFLEEH
ncbi:MAG TPA: leucine-rich repeat domain-containing protein, partial [Chroococcales cyanobacterium]